MENVPPSLVKRSFFSNSDFTSHKSVYDDVFSGHPTFGLATLAPRLEDYSEIFGGFHSSRSSSIPLLHLPLVGEDPDLHLDVRSPSFDYTEVFGDVEGFPFTASLQDLLGQSGGGYDSSDEQWSQAQSETLSDELDPLAESDKNCRLSDGEVHHSPGSITQFNVSYDKSSQRDMRIVSDASSHVGDLNAVPQYTYTQDKSTVSWHGEDSPPKHVTDDANSIEGFGERVMETKSTKSGLLNPLHGGLYAHTNDFNPSKKHGNFPWDKPFMTVSDISLRTKPSQMPPPSRPPPALVVKLKDSFGSVMYDSSSILHEVKGDDSIFAEGRTNGDTGVKTKPESDKESIEGRNTCHLDAVPMCSSEDEVINFLDGQETRVFPHAIEDGLGSRKSTEETSDAWELHSFNHINHKSAGAAAWREATGYIEVIENKLNGQGFNMVGDGENLMQHLSQDNFRHRRTTEHEEFNQKESSEKFIGTKVAPERNPAVRIQQARWDEEKHPREMSEEQSDLEGKPQKEKQDTRSNEQILGELGGTYVLSKTAENFQHIGESESLEMTHSEILEGWPKATADVSEVEAKVKLKALCKGTDIEERSIDSQVTEQNTGKKNILKVECRRRCEDVKEEITGRVKRRAETAEIEKQCCWASEKESNNKLKETWKKKESSVMILEEDKNYGESANNSVRVSGHEIYGIAQQFCGLEEDNKSLGEAGKQKVIELTHEKAVGNAEKDKEHNLVHEREVIKGRNGDTSQTEYNAVRYGIVENKSGDEEENFETKGTLNLCRDACIQSEPSGFAEVIEPIERNGYDGKLKKDPNGHAFIDGDRLKIFDRGCKLDQTIAGKFSVKHDALQLLELDQTTFSTKGHRELKGTKPKHIIYDAEAEVDDTMNKEKISIKKSELQDGKPHIVSSGIVDSCRLPKQMTDSSLYENMGVSCDVPDKRSSQLKYSLESKSLTSIRDDRCGKIKGTQSIGTKEVVRDTFIQCQESMKPSLYGSKVEDAPSMFEHNENPPYSIKTVKCQRFETKDKNMKVNLPTKDQNVWERMNRETELENDHMRKIEEEREREREREKDRMAVDKVALEAHERLYAEARKRAERAAVERTTAEVRPRAMGGTHERLERLSVEARLRTELATTAAQQRVAEKSSAQKAGVDTRDHAEKYVSDRLSASFRSDDTRQSYLSSDLQFQSMATSKVLRYSYSSAGAEGESPQRCKARLERYRRTAERAANALAEKNRRDLLAQREREERIRVAEVLDAEIKRWSSGKEGNLRALLSTLQYILGPDSGWQPVPLTEVITSAAVKKSYRKATLCVHPDKLQQRGASIQQKYICEKVFDLLKEAWNKFNSEEQ